MRENWDALTVRQKFGYWLVRLLGAWQQWVYHRIIRDLVWRSADGRCTPIHKMSDTHIYNAYRMLAQRGDQPEMVGVFLREIARRRI